MGKDGGRTTKMEQSLVLMSPDFGRVRDRYGIIGARMAGRAVSLVTPSVRLYIIAP